jgi:small subunit ribosomal protein S6
MRKYETVFILDPDLKDQARTTLYDRVKDIISKGNGILLDLDEWGNKKLAYEIKKKFRGFYVCVTYGGTGSLVKELERNLRLSDTVLKFMTLLLSDDVTMEQLEQETKEDQDLLAEKADKESVEENTLEDDKQVEETKEKKD